MVVGDGKLTPLKIARIKAPGRFGDGRRLYLQVYHSASGELTKTWVYRYHAKVARKSDGVVRGLVREMGLGVFPAVTLAEARSGSDIVKWCRDYCDKLRMQGIDPIEARKDERAQKGYREREGSHIQRGRGALHQVKQGRMEEQKTRCSMGSDP